MDNNATTFTDTITASTAVTENMRTYIRYSNIEFLPNIIDGLKLLWRRILLVLNESKDMMKCTALTGVCMQTYHPHGDNGVEDGIISLGQPFKQAHPWLVIKGNFGAYGGAEEAAGRYLDVYQSPFAKDIFFSDVDMRTLSYMQSETGKGYEPIYLIPVIPTAFLFGGKRLSAGFSSNTPFLNFKDVCLLVEKFIKLRKKYPYSYWTKFNEIAKYCIPDFPVHSRIRNKKQILEAYIKGNFNYPIVMDGMLDIEPTGIHIKTIPYGTVQYEDIFIKRLGQKMNTANFVSSSATEILDLSNGLEYGDIHIKLKRNINPFEVLDKFKAECSFTQSWTPMWYFVDQEGCVVEMNPMQLLEVWYTARYRSVLAGLKFVNNDLFHQYRKLAALVIIADHTDEVIDIFKRSANKEETMRELGKAYNLTREQAEYVAGLQLHQITRQGKDDLIKALADVKEKIKEHQHKFENIDELIINAAKKVLNTYADECKRKTELPLYIGAIYIKEYSGVIQFETTTELIKLYHRWSKAFTVEVYLYNGTLITENMSDDRDLPKEFMANKFQSVSFTPKTCVTLKSGYIFRMEGVFPSADPKAISAYVDDKFTVVKRGFKLCTIDAESISKRASMDASGQRTDIVYFDGNLYKNALVAIVDTNAPNIVTLRIMKDGDTKPQPLMGRAKIIKMCELGNPLSLTIPEEFVTRCATRNLIIFDTLKFMSGHQELQINFNRKRVSDGRPIEFLHKNAEILSDMNLKGKLE